MRASSWIRWLFVAMAALPLAGAPAQPAHAQAARRWLADPALLAVARGPGQVGQQLTDSIVDMDLISAYDGWAVSYASLLRFDGRWWRRQATLQPDIVARAIDFSSPTEGWVAGSAYDGGKIGGMATYLGRVDVRTGAIVRAPIVRKDGGSGDFAGQISDLALWPGQGMAVGTLAPEPRGWNRPLVLWWDASAGWRDITPAEWGYGQLSAIAMTAPDEAWVTGLAGRPGGSGAEAVRPVIWHYRGGVWDEQQLPALPTSGQPFSMGQIVMKDAGEGWAVFRDAGTRCPSARLLYFHGGIWVAPEHEYAAWIALGLIPGTTGGWISLGGCAAHSQGWPDRRYRFERGALAADGGGGALVPQQYALLSDAVQWAAAGGSPMRYSADALPTARVDSIPAGGRWFRETGHTLAGEFRSYYESHGLEMGDRGVSERESLALFGYPVSEPFDEINPETGQVLRVQYFERARFELHPENQPPYRVLLGRLGFASYLARFGYAIIPSLDASPMPVTCERFAETGYPLCPPLRDFWRRSGALPVFGFPINAAAAELSRTDGQSYLTQWFERERLEHHPELRGTAYEVLLGLLGSEDLRARGLLP